MAAKCPSGLDVAVGVSDVPPFSLPAAFFSRAAASTRYRVCRMRFPLLRPLYNGILRRTSDSSPQPTLPPLALLSGYLWFLDAHAPFSEHTGSLMFRSCRDSLQRMRIGLGRRRSVPHAARLTLQRRAAGRHYWWHSTCAGWFRFPSRQVCRWFFRHTPVLPPPRPATLPTPRTHHTNSCTLYLVVADSGGQGIVLRRALHHTPTHRCRRRAVLPAPACHHHQRARGLDGQPAAPTFSADSVATNSTAQASTANPYTLLKRWARLINAVSPAYSTASTCI